MPRGRYQQKQWEAREAAILDALETLSEARGFAQVTMDDVADAVGISKATLYQHFESKDTMLARLMAQHTAQFLDRLAQTAGQPPVERLRQAMRCLMEEHLTPLRGLISTRREDAAPVFYNTPDLMAQHARTLETLCAIVSEGQASGTIAPDIAPCVVISAMWALSNVSLRAYEPLKDSQEMPDRAAFASQLQTLFERSIRPT